MTDTFTNLFDTCAQLLATRTETPTEVTTTKVVEPWFECPSCHETKTVKCIEGVETCVKCKTRLPSEHMFVTHVPGSSARNSDASTHKISFVDEMLPDCAMGTTIGKATSSSESSRHLTRVSRWRRTVPSKERMLRAKFSNIAKTCHEYNINPMCIGNAKKQYYNLIRKIETSAEYAQRRGNNDIGLQAVSVYLSLTDADIPCTISDVASWFRIEQKYVTSALNIHGQLTQFQGSYGKEPEEEDDASNVNTNMQFLQSYIRNLDLASNQSAVDRIVYVYKWVVEHKVLERCTPQTTIAGCINYVANEELGLGIPIEKVGLSCNLTSQTINDASTVVARRAYEFY